MIKKINIILVFQILLTLSCSSDSSSNDPDTPNSQPEEGWIEYTPDLTSNLRNPAMGWMMYEEGWSFDRERPENIWTPELFWEEMEKVNAPAYSNILYIRMKWKLLEPEEGKYAWIHDEKYKEYINKAKEHGLKLAFRVFFDGGVPQYVYNAGAGRSGSQPYYDDPIFQQKFFKFLDAFAKEYNNPDLVDYVDAYGLGTWGEGHGVTLKNNNDATYKAVIENITGAYAERFDKVLTVMNLSRHDWKFTEESVYKKGILPRRDGIGSHWFDNTEREYLHQLFSENKLAFIGEGCYWFNASSNGSEPGYTDDFKEDKRFQMNTMEEALTVSVDDALKNHSNTLDLRVPSQCKFWIEKLPGEVQKFITNGGYRLYPARIKVDRQKNNMVILHSWRNYGKGMLPNNHPSWNHKYQLTFSLLDSNKNVVYKFTDNKVEPAEWLKGNSYDYTTQFTLPSQLKGKYTLCVGLTDKTKDHTPGIELSIPAEQQIDKWIKISDLEL